MNKVYSESGLTDTLADNLSHRSECCESRQVREVAGTRKEEIYALAWKINNLLISSDHGW